MYIKRALESVVKTYSDYFKVVVVTGPRQVGKTTMLKHLMEEESAKGAQRSYVTLDNTSVRMLAKEDPALFLQRYQPPILIDEIQYAPELLPFIKIVVDESDQKGLFWLTGSQPFHLMRHVSESLAGRAGVVEMLGLSDAEIQQRPSEPFAPSPEYYLRRVGTMPEKTVTEVFERISASSFPAIRELPPEVRGAAYDSYIDTYLMRDIRDLAQVADELKFRRFMAACAALTSKPVVYADLARTADIDQKTAKAWLSLLVSSYLVKIVEPYSNNLIKRLSKQPIMHFTDAGLAAHLAGWTSPQTLEAGAMSGLVFESHVFGEIYKSYCNAGKTAPVFFFKTNDRKEIDLLLERDGTLYPVEVKKSASPQVRDLKNFSALASVAAEADPALAMFRREIGCGTLVCMVGDTFPVSANNWAFPAWAI
ncbi:MAG: ATP-binding protein [Adlercreutzia sp.]|uniref:ATP-binding protein n=1 Tax=uncultured Adlercreutzia sp. TaxID=875803 RepID=UPI00217248F5|nr:ATP-binding protein [uncultured Adlercreutzia sp.]MCI8425758.1 ATP-binding protein [Adlercreutzia sp.]